VIPDLDWWDVLIRLVVAGALTGAIGLERELRDRAAGLRTHMLVGIGAALFTIVSAYGWGDFQFSNRSGVVFDPTRIAAQVVTGIGFLGAGIIFRQGFTIRGLTTAASLWLVAAIGMAAAAGFWKGAVIATIVALVSLRPLEWMKEATLPERVAANLVVVLREEASSGHVIDALEHSGDVHALRREGRRLDVEIRIDHTRRGRALDAVAASPEVEEASWRH
jgi:putative Mg2+ transporter-C (MgtC) family protein